MPPSHVDHETRRHLIRGSAAALGTLVLGACAPSPPKAAPDSEPDAMADDLTATEGLMREHGVLRRVLLVFSGVAANGNRNGDVTTKALHSAAQLFRDFGCNYHEQKLEESYIFPDVKKAGSTAATYVDILQAQHARGREITDYILSLTSTGKIPPSRVAPLNQTMQQFARMYQHHMAWEETIVFPAWKNALRETDFDELGDKFEAIADQQFGKDSYQEVVDRIAAIEVTLNMADLAQFTAPAPPTDPANPANSISG